MRPWTALLCLLPTLVGAQTPETATSAQLAARRCWEKTALALSGRPGPAQGIGGDSAQFPWTFRPDLVPIYFGDQKYNPAFANRFAGFVSARWQREQSTLKELNVPYLVAQYVVGKGLPWRQAFLGRYDVDFYEGRGAVFESPTGLGYFRVKEWLRQNAGAEVQGYKLSTAYRMLNNTLGIKLTASASNTLGDASATGRAAPGCTGCHFTGPFPLDLVARVLDRREGFGPTMTFVPGTDGPQQLWGQTITDDESLITFLVNSQSFTFNTCRLVFEFLQGRPESTCDAPVFDACVAGFEAQGTIQAAVMAMVRHPDFCR